ncbi:MAG: hypothetical protein ACLPKB_13295 [Xanthobacteraceae bacterium]
MIARKLTLATIAAIPFALAAVGGAQARTIYDGSWNVVINGQTSDCQGTFNYAVRIADGIIGYGGGDASLYGRVAPSGAVQVRVVSGGRSASGSGRLSRNFGSGSFRGRSATGICAGSWVAQRTGG